jgi:hypothetical protein
VIFFFKILKKVGFFLKNSSFKNILNDLEVENLRKLVFRHTKLKLLTKTSISCLSHPSMSITTWFMKCFRNCVFAKNYSFLHFHGAISEKLQHIKLWKFAVFRTSRGTSSLPSINSLAPSDPYMGRTAQLTLRCCILNTYSTSIRTEYFKHAA